MISQHYRRRKPSAIRIAGIRFAERGDGTEAVNVAIGNVSLPMHPRLTERMRRLGAPGSPFAGGVLRYPPTVGFDDTRQAFRHVIAASGGHSADLHVHITEGGSAAMELVVLGVSDPPGKGERPLLLIDPAYTNYRAFGQRTGRRAVSIRRTLGADGRFTLPDMAEIEAVIEREKPGALVVIPYDNPTGQFLDQRTLVALARLCVRHDLGLVSDEAYRELFYTGGECSSIWRISEDEVPGITGRRIGIETSSKVWNACGLRIGAIVTDNRDFHRAAVAEATANLCANAIGQWMFAGLLEESHESLRAWFSRQREYYRGMMTAFTDRVRELVPGIVVSSPDAALYSVVDVREIANGSFDALEFVMHCAAEGRVEVDGKGYTLLTAPMAEFYDVKPGEPNPGRTQLRIAYVETPDRMALVPELLASLLGSFAGVGGVRR